MILDPLTPPPENPSEVIDIDNNGVSLAQEQFDHAGTYNILSTPTSNSNVAVDGSDDGSDEVEVDGHDDDDQDMSDGGAALTLTMSHVEGLNNELDMLDAEVMGAENLIGLFNNSPFASLLEYPPYLSPDAYPLQDQWPDTLPETMEGEMEEEEEEEDYGQDVLDTSDLPAAMTEVSQQLQHLQDGQQHAEFQIAPEGQHSAFINNSITPFFFPHVSAYETNNLEAFSEAQSIAMSDVSATNSTSVAVSLHTDQYGGEWAAIGWGEVVPSLPHQTLFPDSHITPADLDWDEIEADNEEVEDQFNLALGDFLYRWGTSSAGSESRRKVKRPCLIELHKQSVEELKPIKRTDLQGDICDMQRINWEELGVSRLEARQMRRQTYKNYTNLRFAPQWHPRLHGAQLQNDQNFFRFRRMDFDHRIYLSHFQLRNLLSCASKDHIFYAGRSKIIQWNPTSGTPGPKKVIMDLTEPNLHTMHAFSGGVQISALTVDHNILVAGGFCGEYSLVNLRAHKDAPQTEGIVTEHQNSITNHVQVQLSRSSLSPQVIFASNDNGVRILDVGTNKFVADHAYDQAINCTAISPDQRLRVLVGDSCEVMICNAETGKIIHNLEGHRDYGFACDWADDGWTVATGNQDMQIKIWDARKWTTSSGLACPVTTIAAEMAGVRRLKFSPLGSGKRVLVAAEPADIVNIIDAETFSGKQTLSFFGEIGGFDFTNGGRDLLIANCDSMRGGLVEYERADLASGSLYGVDDIFDGNSRHRSRKPRTGYDWRPTDEETTDDPHSWGTLQSRRRQAAHLGGGLGHF